MTHPAQATGPESNLGSVLAKLGRASAPEVAASRFGLTLGTLLQLQGTQSPSSVLLVGGPALRATLERVTDVMIGVPGALRDQAAAATSSTLVIDWSAFAAGPWLWANRHEAKSLGEEVFDAGRILRAAGSAVWGIPGPPRGSLDAYLLSTCTVDLSDVPPVDLEERAPQSQAWLTAREFATRGPGSGREE